MVGFNPKKVLAHPKVIEWNRTLRELESDSQQRQER